VYSSTCFRCPDAHHQELNNCSSSLWLYHWSVVVAVLLVVFGLAQPQPTAHAHHQELNNCSSSLWFYRWSVVRLARPQPTALLPPRSNGKTRDCYCRCWAPDDGREDAWNKLICTHMSSNKLEKLLHLVGWFIWKIIYNLLCCNTMHHNVHIIIHIYYFHLDYVITWSFFCVCACISVAQYSSHTKIFCGVIPGYKITSWDI
jgi:hypothetical protein